MMEEGKKHMANAAAPAVPLSPQQVAMMSASQRQAYFNSLPANQQSAALAAYQQYQVSMNRAYMKNTLRKIAVCPQSSGGALSQAWNAGQVLNYTIPSANNAFTEGVIVRMVLSVTLATGTSATYAANAAWPLNLIDNILVTYNGTQHRFRPYILKYLSQLMGYLNPPVPYTVIAANSDSTTQNYLNTGINFSTTGSAQNLYVEFYVPFNALHPQDARGLLPTMGGETVPQVAIQCCSQPLGVDPILNCIAATGGSGNAVTVTGTVQVYAVYRDGTSLMGPITQALDLSGLGTCQYAIDIPLNNLQAGTVYRQKVSILDKLYWVISTIVDGNQSSKFASNTNILVLEADKDSVGNNVFWKYGIGTNLSVEEYFAQFRAPFGIVPIGQDLDEGIIPWVTAPIYNEPDPANLGGTHYLDTSLSGWTDFHYGVQLNSVGSVSGINPRVETHVILINSQGLQSAS